MYRTIPLLLLCLLLCGCGARAPISEPRPTAPQTYEAPTASPSGYYDPNSSLEQQYPGVLRVYPLAGLTVTGIRATGSGLVVFSGEDSTTLTLLHGDQLRPMASAQLDFQLDPKDPSLQLGNGTISFFDPVRRQTVVLDTNLKEVSHIAAPEKLVGTPILSPDRNTLYYCTNSAIFGWDLESGIHRCIKETAYPTQSLTGLSLDGTVLQCTVLEGNQVHTLLLSPRSGRLFYDQPGLASFSGQNGYYYLSLPSGLSETLIFGKEAGAPQIFLPADVTGACFFLEQMQGAVTAVSRSGMLRLDCYDLTTGQCRGTFTLKTKSVPTAIADFSDGGLYILLYDPDYNCQVLYRWETSGSPPSDSSLYTFPYIRETAPDLEGIAQCQDYARTLGEKYGIEILVGQDAAQVQPWDYDLTPEYQPAVLMRELKLLDSRLGQYPDKVLSDTAAHFSSLKICILQSIHSAAESGSQNPATGVQFFQGTDAYVAITSGRYSEQALYHELFHVMETHLLTDSIALDQWDTLNPAGFSYSLSSVPPQEGAPYLGTGDRSFVDAYAMCFPKEDRARVMEAAMLPGNESLFRSSPLQAKLQTLCKGIREAYRLRKSTEAFPWEQYLETPLAYRK